MKTLKEKSQEFIELGEKITQGEWVGYSICPYKHDIFWHIKKDGVESEVRQNGTDEDCLLLIPQMLSHINALQAVIEGYEARIESLRELSKIKVVYRGYTEAMLRAIQVMTGEDE